MGQRWMDIDPRRFEDAANFPLVSPEFSRLIEAEEEAEKDMANYLSEIVTGKFKNQFAGSSVATELLVQGPRRKPSRAAARAAVLDAISHLIGDPTGTHEADVMMVSGLKQIAEMLDKFPAA